MTPFRDDRDALLARNDALQRELDTARRRLAELDTHAHAPAPPPRRSLPLVRWPKTRARLGRYTRIYEIDAELSKEQLVERLRAIEELAAEAGSFADKGARGMAWYGQRCSIELVAGNGSSRLTCTGWQERGSPVLALSTWITIAVIGLAVGISALSWRGLVVALVAAASGYVSVAEDRMYRELAWQRFDRIAARLGVTLPERPALPAPSALPARAALAAGDERAR